EDGQARRRPRRCFAAGRGRARDHPHRAVSCRANAPPRGYSARAGIAGFRRSSSGSDVLSAARARASGAVAADDRGIRGAVRSPHRKELTLRSTLSALPLFLALAPPALVTFVSVSAAHAAQPDWATLGASSQRQAHSLGVGPDDPMPAPRPWPYLTGAT